MTEIVRKAAVVRAVGDDLEFVLSDDTTDRYGDVIEPDGWQLSNFRKNPIALFGHDSSFIVGKWEHVRVEGGKLLGRLSLLPRGVSERLDEIRAAVEGGVLRAVSVGFRVLESEPLQKGIRFIKQDLVECSLVSVPANPNALAVAKSLNLSPEAQETIFGVPASEIVRRDGPSGVTAAPPNPSHQRRTVMHLSQKIEAAQQAVIAARDALDEYVKGDESDTDRLTELSADVETRQSTLNALTKAEKALASQTEVTTRSNGGGSQLPTDPRKPYAVPEKALEPFDHVIRAGVVAIKHHLTKQPMEKILAETYGEDVRTKAVASFMVQRAATVPADTVTPAWAGHLVGTAIGNFMDMLMPDSVYPGLSARGQRFTLGRNGVLRLPYRETTPTVAGSFVGQGAPIPVRQAAFNAAELGLKKMAVITTFTREIMEHSTPAIEQILRNAIREDTAISLDTILLDSNAATTVRPAGIRNGATTAAGTGGGGFAAVVADLRGMVNSLVVNTNGNVRRPTWLMNPAQMLALTLTQNAGGDFPFEAEVNAGRFRGYPLIVSSTVPAGVVILVDAADFATVTGDEPRFDVSDQATLHMEDTSPAQIGSTGTPTVVAAPTRSMYQTDSFALRMILPINWALLRSGMVIVRTAVSW